MQSKALTFHFTTLENPLPSGDALLINAAPGPYLKHLADHNLQVITALANTADKWAAKKIETAVETDEKFDLIIHFATKFATENIATIGRYAQQLNPGGTFITVIPNKTGASRLSKDFSKLFSEKESSSKAKCRIFQTSLTTATIDDKLARKWASLNKPKLIKDTEFCTVPGVFSAEKIDTGSELMSEILKQESWYGSVADLGSAYGYLSHVILSTPRPKMKNLCLYELDQRALDCAKQNLSAFDTKIEYHWTDVTQKVPHERKFDCVIMNPPFHAAQDSSFALGKKFIEQAANILKPGGTLFLVANIHLPYEEDIQTLFRSHRLLKEDKGFKIFLARK